MKYLLLTLFLLNGCAQLIKGELQPVIVKDANQKIMMTSCGGAVEDWASCYHKASNTCHDGYTVIDRVEDSRGIKRDLTFKCN